MSAVPRLLEIKRKIRMYKPRAAPPKPTRFQLESEGGDSFEVNGPEQVGKIIHASRMGLGLTLPELAKKAKVSKATIFRAENDTNMKGSWGWFRTRVQILSALGLSVKVVKT